MNYGDYIDEEIQKKFLQLQEEFAEKILSGEIILSRMVNKINSLEKRIQAIEDLITAISQLSGLNK